jgi:hypothetical protein
MMCLKDNTMSAQGRGAIASHGQFYTQQNGETNDRPWTINLRMLRNVGSRGALLKPDWSIQLVRNLDQVSYLFI